MKKIYLCGPIECKDWREEIKNELKDKYEFIDPTQRDYRGKEKSHINEIVELNYEDIQGSHIILVLADEPSWGTAMEIHYTYTHSSKVIYLICENQTPSPWLVYHSHHVFKTLKEAIEGLKKLYENCGTL